MMNREESVQFAQKYLEDLLSFFGANITVSSTCEDDVIEHSVPSNEHNSLLIGRNAENLRSLQYIVSTVLRNREAELTRVNIDIADYKKQRADKIADRAREWMREVSETGKDHHARINAADRRVVHKVAEEFDDITTHSEGEGRDRRIVISKQ